MSISRTRLFSTFLRRSTRGFCTSSTAAEDSTKYHELIILTYKAKQLLSEIRRLAKNIQDQEFFDRLSGNLYWNPSQKQGNKRAYDVKVRENDWFARVDMPGIGIKGLRVWFQNDSVYFEGKDGDSKESKDDPDGVREYSSCFHIPPGEYQTDKINAVLKHGVLRISIPKVQS